MQYKYLFDLALILLSTKVLGLFSQRFRLPHVVGALIAGLLLGPAVLGIIQETDFLKTTANLGVIVLMFTSGMETDIHELKKSGKAAFVIALIGVLLPLAGVNLPWSSSVSYYLFFALYLAVQFAVYYFLRNPAEAAYAIAYDAIRPKASGDSGAVLGNIFNMG